MNRLVREHYPVSKLPEDLREGLDGRENVTVTLEAAPALGHTVHRPDASGHGRHEGESWVQYGERVRQVNFASIEDVDAYISSLRD